MARWFAATAFTAGFGLLLGAFILIIKTVFKLDIPPQTVKIIVIVSTIIFGFIIFKRIVGV